MTWVLILYFYVWAGSGSTAAATTAVFQTERACHIAGAKAAKMQQSKVAYVCVRGSE